MVPSFYHSCSRGKSDFLNEVEKTLQVASTNQIEAARKWEVQITSTNNTRAWKGISNPNQVIGFLQLATPLNKFSSNNVYTSLLSPVLMGGTKINGKDFHIKINRPTPTFKDTQMTFRYVTSSGVTNSHIVNMENTLFDNMIQCSKLYGDGTKFHLIQACGSEPQVYSFSLDEPAIVGHAGGVLGNLGTKTASK